MPETRSSRPLSDADIVLRVAIVALTLATAYIHLTLGGLLFTLNAIGYFVGAAALVVPIAIAIRYRWLVRIGLAGYAATTISAWVVQPIFYPTAYAAKVIEVALIALLAMDFVRRDGDPIERIRHEIRSLLARPQGPASGRS
ncbi:MAG: hypothetical protein ACRDIL_03350 [Candidatus Limnocylindrales bacterium]